MRTMMTFKTKMPTTRPMKMMTKKSLKSRPAKHTKNPSRCSSTTTELQVSWLKPVILTKHNKSMSTSLRRTFSLLGTSKPSTAGNARSRVTLAKIVLNQIYSSNAFVVLRSDIEYRIVICLSHPSVSSAKQKDTSRLTVQVCTP